MIHFALISLKDDAAGRVLEAAVGSHEEPASAQTPSHLARALARRLLAYATCTEADRWLIRRRRTGQPFAQSIDGTTLPMSLSHSGDWVACAISDGAPIGIDIEAHRLNRNMTGIAGWAYGAEERRRAAKAPHEFYRIWTLREALAKATGGGMNEVADARDRADSGPECGMWSTMIDGVTWHLAHAYAAREISLGIAWRRPGAGSSMQECTIHRWEPKTARSWPYVFSPHE